MEAIIKTVYQDNLGTAYEIDIIAVNKDSSVRLQDVKDYTNTFESVQTHVKFQKYISFVSNKPLFEFEVD